MELIEMIFFILVVALIFFIVIWGYKENGFLHQKNSFLLSREKEEHNEAIDRLRKEKNRLQWEMDDIQNRLQQDSVHAENLFEAVQKSLEHHMDLNKELQRGNDNLRDLLEGKQDRLRKEIKEEEKLFKIKRQLVVQLLIKEIQLSCLLVDYLKITGDFTAKSIFEAFEEYYVDPNSEEDDTRIEKWTKFMNVNDDAARKLLKALLATDATKGVPETADLVHGKLSSGMYADFKAECAIYLIKSHLTDVGFVLMITIIKILDIDWSDVIECENEADFKRFVELATSEQSWLDL